MDLEKMTAEEVEDAAEQTFLEVSRKFSGDRDSLYLFWDVLSELIEEKLIEFEGIDDEEFNA